MPRVRRTEAAERSLDEIYDHIGRKNHSPAAAARLLRRIAEKCGLYATQPFMGEAFAVVDAARSKRPSPPASG